MDILHHVTKLGLWSGKQKILRVTMFCSVCLCCLVGCSKQHLNQEFITAAEYDGELPFLVELLKDGANVNAQDENGQTALMKMCCYMSEISNCKAKIDFLITQAGADVNIRDKSGQTALMLACHACKSEAVESLVTAKADQFHIEDWHYGVDRSSSGHGPVPRKRKKENSGALALAWRRGKRAG